MSNSTLKEKVIGTLNELGYENPEHVYEKCLAAMQEYLVLPTSLSQKNLDQSQNHEKLQKSTPLSTKEKPTFEIQPSIVITGEDLLSQLTPNLLKSVITRVESQQSLNDLDFSNPDLKAPNKDLTDEMQFPASTFSDRYEELQFKSKFNHAIIHDKIDIIINLLYEHPSLATRNFKKQLPVHIAAENNSLKALKLFCEGEGELLHYFFPLYKNERDIFAKLQEKLNIVSLIFREKKVAENINAWSKGGTPLHLAAEENCVESVKYLLNLGADTSIKFQGATPLERVFGNPLCEDVMNCLLDHERQSKLKNANTKPDIISDLSNKEDFLSDLKFHLLSAKENRRRQSYLRFYAENSKSMKFINNLKTALQEAYKKGDMLLAYEIAKIYLPMYIHKTEERPVGHYKTIFGRLWGHSRDEKLLASQALNENRENANQFFKRAVTQGELGLINRCLAFKPS